MQEVIKIYHKIAKILTTDELEVFIKYIVEARPYTAIGRSKMKLFKPTTDKEKRRLSSKTSIAGKRRVKAILSKLKGLDVSDAAEVLLDNPSMKEASLPRYHIRWSIEFPQNANVGAYWTKPKKSDKRKSEYKEKLVCMIPEFLQNAFGDTKTVCCACGVKCARRDMFNAA